MRDGKLEFRSLCSQLPTQGTCFPGYKFSCFYVVAMHIINIDCGSSNLKGQEHHHETTNNLGHLLLKWQPAKTGRGLEDCVSQMNAQVPQILSLPESV